MGQAVTKIYSIIRREINTYNIEKRAHKIISKDKPTPAPMHPSHVKELQRLKEGKFYYITLYQHESCFLFTQVWFN